MLHRQGAQDPAHPAWQNVLRYTSSGAGDDLYVQQGTVKMPYCFEYLGVPQPQLAVTQVLCQQTHLGMTSALHLRCAPAVVGTTPPPTCLLSMCASAACSYSVRGWAVATRRCCGRAGLPGQHCRCNSMRWPSCRPSRGQCLQHRLENHSPAVCLHAAH